MDGGPEAQVLAGVYVRPRTLLVCVCVMSVLVVIGYLLLAPAQALVTQLLPPRVMPPPPGGNLGVSDVPVGRTESLGLGLLCLSDRARPA